VFYSGKVIYPVETQHILINNNMNLVTYQSQLLITRKHPQAAVLRIKSVSDTVQTTRQLSMYSNTHHIKTDTV